ncbi:MAG: rhomboid family intramembrane serine protease [Kiritimatiellae bacterium]|nr:rhomboid family intramembrane serine protease [Kiritimatiellia bacterium]
MIGTLAGKLNTERFSLFLLSRGITNEWDAADADSYIVWVHSEDQLSEAKSLLDRFINNPQDPVFLEGAATGAQQKRNEDRVTRRVKRTESFRRRHALVSSAGHVTLTIIILCVFVFMLSDMGKKTAFLNQLLISAYVPIPGIHWWNSLIEIRNGQLWRLVTPIFVHFSVLHIIFNMLWLFDLGSMLERKKGSTFLVLFIIAVAIPSNLAQYVFSGPMFGGMSGVVYAMLGYIWMKSRFAPEDKMFLHPTTVTMMLAFLALGFFGVMGNMANMVHTVGLLTGVAWGYLSSLRKY